MVFRLLSLTLSVLVVLTLAAAPPAAAQSRGGGDQGVEQLWKRYPLQEATPAASPSTGGTATSRTGAGDTRSAGGDGGSSPVLWVVLLVVVAALAGAIVLWRRRRRASADGGSPAGRRWAEGFSDRPGVGAFSGLVERMGTRDLLVRDERRDVRLWVRWSEVTRVIEDVGEPPPREPARRFAREGGTRAAPSRAAAER